MNRRNSKFKSVLFMLIKCATASIVALAILSGICFVCSYSGSRIHNESGSTDFKWTKNQYRSTTLEGYSWFFMDKYGFNNIYDNSENPDILLMGSSHMEAANISPSQSVASILCEQLPLDVYNIAISGHTIYSCVNNMDAAVNEYNPSKYLILETMTAELSIQEMQKVIDGELDTIVSYDSGILYWLQKYIPAVKSIYKQVDSWRAADAKPVVEVPKKIEEADYQNVLHDFLLKAKSSAEQSGAKLIIFYHPEIKIDENANAYTEVEDEIKLRLFKETCDELNIIYLDMTKPFIDMYEQHHLLPYGFSNTAVGAAHLNKHGHKAISEELIRIIKEDN